MEQLISAAKSEKELFFVAGPTTFGGKKGSGGERSRFQPAIRVHCENTFQRWSRNERNGGAGDRRAQSRRQSIDRYLSRLAGPVRESVARRRVARSELVRDFPVDRPTDGRDRFTERRAGLLFAAWHRLQREFDPDGKSAKDLRRFDLSAAEPDLGGQDRCAALSQLARRAVTHLGRR